VKSETDGKRDVMNEADKMPSGPSISPVEMTSVIKLELEKDRSAANASLIAASSILKLSLGGTFSVRQNNLQRLDETRSG
jgi:hypothetical protein